MAIILGLDVSTSCTGFCVVDTRSYLSGNFDVAPPVDILMLNRIDFVGCKTFWEKADRAEQVLKSISTDLFTRKPTHGMDAVPGYRPGQEEVDRIVIEEPLMGFRPGMSSAQTITQLMRFNGIVSYIARNVFQREPEYISSAHARKLCGIKLQRTALGGPQKEQVFAHMAAHDLKDVEWPLTKSGKVVPWSRDACDAYVIARAAAINGPIVPVVKKKKKTKTEDVEQ